MKRATGFESNVISEYKESEVEWGFMLFTDAVFAADIGPFKAGQKIGTVIFDFNSNEILFFFEEDEDDPAYRCGMKVAPVISP